MATWLLFMAAAFLCGSIPTGLWVARAKGVDIRRHGSGNIGATNVGRVLGARLGLLCFAIDVAKGFAPTLAAGLWFGLAGGAQPEPLDAALWLAVMACTVLGHMFTPWAGFRGGKGVATGLGATLGVYPFLAIPALAALTVWVVVLALWRYVSLASILAALVLPLFVALWAAARAVFVLDLPESELIPYRTKWIPFIVVASVLAAAVVVRHRGNIRRLIAGRELRMGERVNPAGPGPAAPPPAEPPPPPAGSRT